MKRESRVIAEFFVSGEPVPWRPPRVTRNGSHSYTPSHVREWQKIVSGRAILAMHPRPPVEGPVSLVLIFTKRPAKARPGEHWWAARPDWVNLAKCVEDALNGVVFRDDNQVVSARVVKLRGDNEGVTVRVVAIGEGSERCRS